MSMKIKHHIRRQELLAKEVAISHEEARESQSSAQPTYSGTKYSSSGHGGQYNYAIAPDVQTKLDVGPGSAGKKDTQGESKKQAALVEKAKPAVTDVEQTKSKAKKNPVISSLTAVKVNSTVNKPASSGTQPSHELNVAKTFT